ncbi:MAG: hypothetical protein E7047_03345 [Lentisphaerae bacterium]|nr:hypothetical protein [Lentisphaerota bacterium]
MTNTVAANQLKVGLSLPYTEPDDLQNIHDIPECFELLELSGELVAGLDKLRSEHSVLREFELVNFRNLLPASLTGQLTTAGSAIVNEYKKRLRELFALAHCCHAECVSIDPDWEAVLEDDSRIKVLEDVLRSSAGDRHLYNLNLALSVRFPGTGQMPLTESVKLLHKLSGYRVGLALDINPHELLNSNIDWAKLLKHFRFDTSCIRFCYLSELGNKLLYRHIEPIIKVIKSWQREINVYIAPSGRADLAELAETAQAINTESSAL